MQIMSSTGKRTIEYVISPDLYAPDIHVMAKYQEFSAEILRMSLLLLAGFGFLLKEVVIHEGATTTFFGKLASSKGLLLLAIIGIGLASASALAHRYFSTDAIATEVAFLRRSERARSNLDDEGLAQERDAEHKRMIFIFKIGAWCLRLSVTALTGAAVAVAIAFARTLFC